MWGWLSWVAVLSVVAAVSATALHPRHAWRFAPAGEARLESLFPLPDAAGSADEGRGFSATGLARSAEGWVVGNDGRARDPEPEAGSTPGLVFLGDDGVREVPAPPGATVQGVVVDPVDGAIWTSSPSAGLIRKLDPVTGAVRASLPFHEPNGLALGPGGALLVLDRARDVHALSPAGEATFLLHAVHGDGLHYEAGADLVWTADNAEARAFDLAGRRLACRVRLPGITHAEGIVAEAGRLWVVHNGAFHATSTPPADPPRSLIAAYRLPEALARRCYGRAPL